MSSLTGGMELRSRAALSTNAQTVRAGVSSHFAAHEPASDHCGDMSGLTRATERQC